MRRYFFAILVSLCCATAFAQNSAPPSGMPAAKETIEKFYQAYLSTERNRPKYPPFSRAFLQADKENKRICREKADHNLCGWDVNGDPYLDAQHRDDYLIYDPSTIWITEPTPGVVEARINVFPSRRDGRFTGKITYFMIQDQGQWVVDDMLYDDKTRARAMMQKENASYQMSMPK